MAFLCSCQLCFPKKFNFSIRIYTRKLRKYGCIWPMIIIIFFWIRKSRLWPTFFWEYPFFIEPAVVRSYSIFQKKIFFCSLKPYHKLASRKKQNILQKFKEQAIDNVSSYDTYILCYLQFFKVGKVTTWVKYG